MRIFILILISFLIFENQLFSQCCAAGNPVSGSGSSENEKNVLKVSSLYMHSFSDTYFEGTEASDFQYKETFFDFSLFSLSYGLTKKLTLKSEIGYFYNKSEYFVLSDYERYAYGLGDAAISGNYNLYFNEETLFSISSGFSLKIPVGVADQVYENVFLPIDLQPSSGSYRYTPNISIFKGFNESKFSISSDLSVEFAQAIKTERTEKYKYGNLYLISLKGMYKLNKYSGLSLQIREQIREQAYNKDVIVAATGGNVLFASPSISATFKDFNFSATYNYPIYKDLNSKPGLPQLSNKYSFTLNLAYNINFNKKDCEIDSSIFNDLQSQSFFVDGACGMCKDRIENIAYKQKSIKLANWDVDKKILTIKYDKEVDIDKLKNALANAGHDSDTIKASDKAYSKLHSCCKYRKE